MPNSESNTASAPLLETSATVLSSALQARAPGGSNRLKEPKSPSAGLHVPSGVAGYRLFDDLDREMDALFHGAGLLDLGSRAKLRVTGGDRLRWLNGMVTNTVQALPPNEGNYSFVLNAQGRIQADCYIYRRDQDLLLDTSREQVPTLLAHLNHYIIMDDVELVEVSDHWTALGLAGPKAKQILCAVSIPLPEPSAPGGNARLWSAQLGATEVIVVEAHSVAIPRYELWFAPQDVLTVWDRLQAAGATPVGWEAAEILRVLEGIPVYGVDLNDRDLPQETNQTRALNFTKGCYLGQEIVERIRSRGKVHRKFRQFQLEGGTSTLPFELQSEGQTVGRITSVGSVSRPNLSGTFGLGFAREETVERQLPIKYAGGTAQPLETPPLPTR